MEIRRASPGDAERLAAVYRSAYAENERLGFPSKAGAVTAETVATWIAEANVFVADDGAVVGGVRLERTAPGRFKISRLGVHERRKREGIGAALLDRAERAAAESGADVVWLTTPPDHPYLPAFYRERGYERTEPYPLEYREYDEVVMERRVR